MRQWREYEKTLHLYPIRKDLDSRKLILAADKHKLFSGTVFVTEKMDGANTGIYKSNGKIFLTKRRGIADGSHVQFKRFNNEWFWNNKDKIESLPDDFVYYGELMFCVHSIFYDRLPDWWLMFDIYDLKNERYLEFDKVMSIANEAKLHTVPLISIVENPTINDIISLLPIRSKYGNTAEGLVAKNYRSQIRAKMVNERFIKQIEEDEHWSQRERFNEVFTD